MQNGLLLDSSGTICASHLGAGVPGWQFHAAASLNEIEALLATQGDEDYAVGLIVLNDLMPTRQASWAAMEDVLASSRIDWIALVPPHAPQDITVCRCILRMFHDYHTLPLDMPRLAMTIGHVLGMRRLKSRLHQCSQDNGRFGMIGQSPLMQQLYRQLEKIVLADDPVLVGGASGTGKELVARAIHRYSARSHGPYVAVDCGAIPANLIQSELFGYEKGAFTGALRRTPGKIEAANGGVLFLDEIGNLPLDMQTNLLRFLQERSIVRLGSSEPVPVEARIIAATHINLAQAVASGHFREDLYYRLNVLHLELPHLKSRIEDIPLLAADIFTRLASTQPGLTVSGISHAAMRAMLSYEWPGNVRELINRLKRGMIMSEQRLLSASDLGFCSDTRQTTRATLEEARTSFENQMVEACLRSNGNNVARTARQLGISRMTMYRLINKLNITLERPARDCFAPRSC